MMCVVPQHAGESYYAFEVDGRAGGRSSDGGNEEGEDIAAPRTVCRCPSKLHAEMIADLLTVMHSGAFRLCERDDARTVLVLEEGEEIVSFGAATLPQVMAHGAAWLREAGL